MSKHRVSMRVAALALPVLIVLALAASAGAATSTTVADIYNAPSALPTGNGTLTKYSQTSVSLGAGAPAVNAWRIQYTSTMVDGSRDIVTGTVIVPTKAWPTTLFSSDKRPIVAYAVGTQGLGKQCAPSKQIGSGAEYENANIVAALNRNYAVVVTDNDGYVNGTKPTYIVGENAARALLDGVRAGTQVPNVGVSIGSSKIAIWGYSQGGQTAAKAGEIEGTYAPELRVAGVAAGGVPADLNATAHYLDGANGMAFLLSSIYGLSNQYPSIINLNTLANANGKAAIADAEANCVFNSLFKYQNHSLAEYTVGNKTLDQFLSDPAILNVVNAQKLGGAKIPVPLYLYHGTADEFIPLQPSIDLKKAYCNKGTNVTYGVYPSEHIATQFQAAPQALDFLSDRLNGAITLGTCLTLKSTPKANGNNPKGDFIISQKQWPLTGKVGLKLLGQDVTLPSGATFTADDNVTKGKLQNATMTIPTFDQNLTITLIPVTVRLGINAVSVNGNISVDDNGILHIHGNAAVDITVHSLGEGSLQIPVGCHTATPANIALNYDGPVSDLGNGKVAFSGSTTFASMTGCGLLNLVLTGLMSGPGQTYAFSIAPPAPSTY